MLAKRPTDRRAGCGKTARPVRREGQGKTPCSYPYRHYWVAALLGGSIKMRTRIAVCLDRANAWV